MARAVAASPIDDDALIRAVPAVWPVAQKLASLSSPGPLWLLFGKFSTLNSSTLPPCSVGVMIAITPTVSPPFGPSPVVVQLMTKPPSSASPPCCSMYGSSTVERPPPPVEFKDEARVDWCGITDILDDETAGAVVDWCGITDISDDETAGAVVDCWRCVTTLRFLTRSGPRYIPSSCLVRGWLTGSFERRCRRCNRQHRGRVGRSRVA